MGRLIIESKAACKGKEAMIGRDEIFRYVRKKYNVAEDYPLPTAPTFPVMRHPDTRKWFAIIMDVPKDKLGLTGRQRVDVINVKLSDPLLVDVVTRQDGYFKGYHFNRGNGILPSIEESLINYQQEVKPLIRITGREAIFIFLPS